MNRQPKFVFNHQGVLILHKMPSFLPWTVLGLSSELDCIKIPKNVGCINTHHCSQSQNSFFFPLISVNRHDWPCFSREDCTNLFFVATLSKHTFSWFSTRSGITISGKNTIEGEAVTIDDISARSEIVEIDPAEEKKLLRKVNWKLMPVVSLPTKKTPRRC